MVLSSSPECLFDRVDEATVLRCLAVVLEEGEGAAPANVLDLVFTIELTLQLGLQLTGVFYLQPTTTTTHQINNAFAHMLGQLSRNQSNKIS